MKLKLKAQNESLYKEFENTVRSFYPYIVMDDEAENSVEMILQGDEKIRILAFIEGNNYDEEYVFDGQKCVTQRRLAKRCLYDLLSKITSVKLPYGSLTGVRPTKLMYELDANGVDKSFLHDFYRVDEKKVDFIKRIVDNQKDIHATEWDKIDLFINIPICVSRCSYCSFLSIVRDKLPKSIIVDYVAALKRELEFFYTLFKKDDIRSVYIGGGTPTSLTAAEMEEFLSVLDLNDGTEFTLEAGRPDTISKDKLDVMKNCKVTRISVNPQSFSDKTLALIGRNHTSEDIYRTYELVRQYPFQVNMDLIASLPGETMEDFSSSVDKAVELSPENITVHTLALKNGSSLKLDSYENRSDFSLPSEMVDYARNKLLSSGYQPYYMYRLKNMSGGLENAGYFKGDSRCLYNVDTMDETQSVYSIGAGGIAKKLTEDGGVFRLSDSKDLRYYLSNLDKSLEEKKSFWRK